MRQWGIEYEPDQQHVSRALKALGLTNAEGAATPGTDDVGGPKANRISELRRTAKWHDPPEEIREEEGLLTGRIETISEGGGKIQFLCDGQARSFVLSERTGAENGFTTHPRPHRPQESSSIQILIPADDLQICMVRVWTAIFEVFDDANFAGCTSTRKYTVGGVAKWSGQIVEASSKTMGVLALSSGESELAAVVRAATEAMGLQSILNVGPRGD